MSYKFCYFNVFAFRSFITSPHAFTLLHGLLSETKSAPDSSSSKTSNTSTKPVQSKDVTKHKHSKSVKLTLHADGQTNIKTERTNSETSDIDSELAHLSDVMVKLSASAQSLESCKAAYSIGISLDPEDFEEDETSETSGE
jgi:hypothetical protein